MKVPCPECNQLCRRKVVNRSAENLNRIYYKCEACKHKVGWEDELMAGAAPWRKHKDALPEPPAALPPQQPNALPPPQPAAVPPRPRNPASATGEESEVEIVLERPAPQPQTQKRPATRGSTAKAAGPSGMAPPAAAAPPSAQAPESRHPPPAPQQDQQPQQHPHNPVKPSQAGASMQASAGAPKTRAQKRQAATGLQPGENAAAAAPQPPAVRPAASPRQSNQPDAPNPAPPVNDSAPATKRKYGVAFDESAGPPGKRPVQHAPAVGPAGVFAARIVPLAGGGARATGTYGASAPPAAGASTSVPPTAVANGSPAPGAAAADGVSYTREGQGQSRVMPPPQAPPGKASTGAQAAAAPPRQATVPPASAAAATVPVPGSGSFSPRVTQEMMEMRRLNQELARLKQTLREEQKRRHDAEATVEALRLRQEPLERELRETRHKYQDALARERQIAEQLNVFKVRERAVAQAQAQAAAQAAAQAQVAAAAQQRAQQAAAAHAAAAQQRAAQQAATAQEAARQRAHAQAQAQAQAEYAKQYGFWGFQHQHFNNGHSCVPPQQQEYEGVWYGNAGAGAAPNGNAGYGVRGAGGAGPGRCSGGGAAGHDGQIPNGGGGAAPPPPQQQQQQPPLDPAAPRDDPALLAFATASPPALDDGTSVRVLKQFLDEAGVKGAALSGLEKGELLGIARERMNAWEIRRAVACSRLANQAQGDRALFRIDPGGQGSGGGVQRPAVVKAYRELTLRVHPDKNPNDELATAAFQYLSDAYKRLTGNGA